MTQLESAIAHNKKQIARVIEDATCEFATSDDETQLKITKLLEAVSKIAQLQAENAVLRRD